jgi:hypothetical protein
MVAASSSQDIDALIERGGYPRAVVLAITSLKNIAQRRYLLTYHIERQS